MADMNQAPGRGGPPWPPPPTPDAPEPSPWSTEPASDPTLERGLLIWLAIAIVALGVSLLAQQAEFGAFAIVAGLFAVAHAVDRDPRWLLLHRFLAGFVPSGGVAFFIGIMLFLHNSGAPSAINRFGIALSALCGVACASMLFRRVAVLLVRVLFPGTRSTSTARLAARFVAIGLLSCVPLYIAFRVMLAQGLLADMDFGERSLAGSLVGFILVSLGGVGLFVGRGWRETFDRLGLQRLGLVDLLVLAAGVAVMIGLNSGFEWVQKTWLPADYAFDRRVVGLIAGQLSRNETLLLGVSAGVGEELSMRGALQPRLGLARTSLLFAALHVQYSWFGMLTIMVFGLALGLVRKTRSTTTAIAVHGVYDVLAAFSAQSGT